MYREEDLKSTSYATTKRLFPCVLGLMLALLSAPAFGQGDIHELQYNNFEWVDTDVSAAGGGQEASTGIAAIYTTPNDQRHVYYESPDLDIHQLYFNGSSWSDDDLSVVTDGQQGSDNTAVSAFSIGNAQYVYFCGADSAVHELTYGNNGNFSWVDIALPTGGSEGGCPNSVNGMVAFATSPNNQRHVYFRQDGNPSNIRQLYFNGSTWSNQNLTQMIKGAKKAANGIPMSGFAIGNDQYLFFQSPNGHIHEYSYVDSWSDKDLTVATGAGASSLWQGTAAFVVPGTTQMEVYYAAAKAWDLHRMTFQNNKWADTNLTALTGGFVAESPILGFATTPNDQLHVYLVSGNHDVDQYYFNGADWIDQVLPSVEPDSGEAPSGFSLGNLQYVYYVSFGQ